MNILRLKCDEALLNGPNLTLHFLSYLWKIRSYKRIYPQYASKSFYWNHWRIMYPMLENISGVFGGGPGPLSYLVFKIFIQEFILKLTLAFKELLTMDIFPKDWFVLRTVQNKWVVSLLDHRAFLFRCECDFLLISFLEALLSWKLIAFLCCFD